MILNNIKQLLEDRGWTMYKLHKETGMNYNTIHKVAKAEQIKDTTPYGTLKKIAKALGVGIDDLEDDNK